MRSSSLVIKVLVLTVFVSLVSSFVAYRSGMFTEVLYADSLPENDSTKINRDSLLKWQNDSMNAFMRATSSKSGRIFHGTVIPRETKDTLNKITFDPTFMGSSKSINPIFEDKILKLDSSK